jgi:transposase
VVREYLTELERENPAVEIQHEVGCFLGLRPGRRNSGESEPQKKISKKGDRYPRTMMVHCSA